MTAKAWSANSDHATSITRPSLTPPAGHRPHRSGLRAYSGNSTRLYCCKMVAEEDRIPPTQLTAARNEALRGPATLARGCTWVVRSTVTRHMAYGMPLRQCWLAAGRLTKQPGLEQETTPGSRA